MLDALNQFASAHPWYFAVVAAASGFLVRAFVFTKDNAKKLIKAWFDRERRELKKLGRSQAEIKAAMKEQADFLMAGAEEAESEADAEPAQDAPGSSLPAAPSPSPSAPPNPAPGAVSGGPHP